ncbi:hypothetical protein [Arthrobacter sp. StoSoilB13]|uniref:hypothetical protein n=1 Tax=Arthrobacter sp. StoSoilB13 TaxID=2830993 RepID=UPI001CC4E06B|nr:hypothetical protein [Arthrobacter sp. StoSoilB13]BCW47981.1 hypothetical protein StoSoilB13_03230 [Arthrobacter sp. StoSoilB13]
MPFEIFAVLDLTVSPKVQSEAGGMLPPRVTHVSLELTLEDLEEGSQWFELLLTLAEWSAEFPAPASPARSRTHQIVFLGDLRNLGVVDAEVKWREKLASLAASFGFNAHVVGSGDAFSGAVSEKTAFVFQFDPYGGRRADPPSSLRREPIELHIRGAKFDDVLRSITLTLIEDFDNQNVDEAPCRDLVPGDRIFHRKIGNSRAFDRFDEGSTKPCKHGADSFTRFNGPKSLKGFRRRYGNFEDEWMHHCGKYPNCGMYAVFCPS